MRQPMNRIHAKKECKPMRALNHPYYFFMSPVIQPSEYPCCTFFSSIGSIFCPAFMPFFVKRVRSFGDH